VGGLLFVVLNQIVNRHGGFLRKASTTFFYLRGQRRVRYKRCIERVKRFELLRQISGQDLMDLVDAATSRSFEAGTTLFRTLDPARYLYVVEQGTVELTRTDGKSARLARGDAFGQLSMFTGSPHGTTAVALEDSIVLMIPRTALARLLRTSGRFREAMIEFLQGPMILRYLVESQSVTEAEGKRLLARATAEARDRGELLPAAEFRPSEEFGQIVQEIRRVSFFTDLPHAEVQEIASRVYLKKHERGHTFFHRGEMSDRMYIIESGEVALLDAESSHRSAQRLKDRAAFGTLSFVTGTRHVMTAVAEQDVSVWVLLRVDFDQLLEHCPRLAQAIQQFLQRKEVARYLHEKHNFDEDMIASWVSRAVNHLDHGKLIPHASELRGNLGPQHGAPLAIWLGILLDGVPESMVIGSSMLYDGVSLSLIAGLFLSNYPEALSSSVGMRQQGIVFPRVMLMWTSLMFITGFGAALGNLAFSEAPDVLFSLVEGIAAGAMLTMIAETMLPEAYLKGGSVVGFSTLLGFLAAIFFKTIH
jgi:CRP-like cAMP-binding protein